MKFHLLIKLFEMGLSAFVLFLLGSAEMSSLLKYKFEFLC